jgi:Rne/Rng family ribonuclease
MKKTILIEKTVLFTRIAILLDHELVATYMESALNPDNQNKIIIGQVDNVIKNLNAAFIDYAGDKKGLLHLSQVPAVYQDKMYQGTRIPIQIIKQNEGQKGHKLTAKISIKGKYLVCLPFEQGISISKKIKNQALRNTLKDVLSKVSSNEYGFIVRTHAEAAQVEDIKEDALQLISKVKHLMQIKDNLSKGSILHEDFPMYMQVVIENVNSHEDTEIICDDLEMTKALEEILGDYAQKDSNLKITFFDKKENIYDIYDIQKEMSALQNKKVWLKNGGNIIIDYTEALTVIDVNSAKAILSNNHRKSVLELNQLAVRESILQILRRNLSGIIIIDLIEMPQEEDKEQIYLYTKRIIMQFADKRTTVFPITELGLLQISRSQRYTSIPRKIFTSCEGCHHSFGELSNEYCAYLIEKKVKSVAYQTTNQEMTVQCSKEMLEFIMQYGIKEMLEDKYGIKVHFSKIEKATKSKFLC